MCKNVILNLLMLTLASNGALACNGYQAKIIKLENCGGPDAVIRFDEDFSVQLTKKCEIVPTGCVINKAFTTGVSEYKLTKDDVVLSEGKIDICSLTEQAPDEVKDYLKIFGGPASCPVADSKVCGNNHTVDFSKYKAMLGLARGHIVIDSNIEHDTGKSCFHAELEIKKN